MCDREWGSPVLPFRERAGGITRTGWIQNRGLLEDLGFTIALFALTAREKMAAKCNVAGLQPLAYSVLRKSGHVWQSPFLFSRGQSVYQLANMLASLIGYLLPGRLDSRGTTTFPPCFSLFSTLSVTPKKKSCCSLLVVWLQVEDFSSRPAHAPASRQSAGAKHMATQERRATRAQQLDASACAALRAPSQTRMEPQALAGLACLTVSFASLVCFGAKQRRKSAQEFSFARARVCLCVWRAQLLDASRLSGV